MRPKDIVAFIGILIGGIFFSAAITYAISILPVQQGGTGWGYPGYIIPGAILFGDNPTQLGTSSDLTMSTSSRTLSVFNLTINGVCTGCGAGGGGGGGGGWNFLKGAIYNATSTDQIFMGENSSTSIARLEVQGNGGFAANFKGGASSTQFTDSGTAWLTALTSALLGTDNTGKVVATTSVGTNLLTGLLGTINNTTLNVGGTITINAASSTALGDMNTWTKLQTLAAASSTNLTASNFWIIGQSAGCAQFDANAKLTSTGVNCGTGGGSGVWPFTPSQYRGGPASATSTTLVETGLLAASTTDFTNASTTNLTVFSNSYFNGGYLSSASSTVVGNFTASATTTTAGLNVITPTVGTSTAYIYSKTAGFGGQIILEDTGGGACTAITTHAGVVSGQVVTCPTEI